MLTALAGDSATPSLASEAGGLLLFLLVVLAVASRPRARPAPRPTTFTAHRPARVLRPARGDR